MFVHGVVRLRKIEEEDLEALLELKRESWPYTHHTTIANRSDQLRWFQGLDGDVHAPRNLVLAAGLADADEFSKFGAVILSDVDYIGRSAWISWHVFSEHRGQGLGKSLLAAGAAFGFEILNLRRVSTEILDDNLRSQRCAQAAGFVEEGRQRAAVYKQHEYVDSLLFGLLRSDLPADDGKGASRKSARKKKKSR